MKIMSQTLLALVAALMFSSAYAECIIPETIPVPDGATVTEEEMLAAGTSQAICRQSGCLSELY